MSAGIGSMSTDPTYLLADQYRDASNLHARMELHERFRRFGVTRCLARPYCGVRPRVSSTRAVLRRLTPALAVALIATACQVSQTPAPVGVALLKAGTPRRLTDRAALSPAAWAPDGQALAYADRQGMWIAELGGRERKVVATGVATAVDWSPRTGLLAYIDQGKVWVIRPDGAGRRRIPLPPQNGIPAFATHLIWAPGGDRLAVAVQSAREAPTRGRVWLVSPDGGFRRLVFEAPSGQAVAALQWFPDSLYLFIALGPEDGPREVTRLLRWRVVYPDRRTLPRPIPGMVEPRLSPNGRWIAFVAPEPSRSEEEHVWVMRVDGTGLRRLSREAGHTTSLAWAPASDKVAYARVLDEARGEVWVADVEGGGRLRVADFTAEFPDPNLPLVVQWSSDGRHLAFGSNSGSYTGPIWVLRLERR